MRLFFAIIITAAISVLLVNFNIFTVGLAIAITLSPLIIIKPKWYFVFFLITRPIMDIFSGHKIGGINLASVFTILLIVICGALLSTRENIAKIKNNPFLRVFNRAFIIFLIFSLASLVNSKDIINSLAEFFRLASILIAVNYTVIFFPGKNQTSKLITLIIFSYIVPLTLGAYQYFSKSGMPELGFNRIFGSFTHPNVYAQYLLIIFFVLLYVIVSNRNGPWIKLLLYFLLAMTVLSLLHTFTRGAWITVSLSFLLFALIKTRFSEKLRYLFIICLIAAVSLPYALKRFEDINEKKYYRLSSWQWRLQQWNETIEELNKHPFIGNGMDMYEYTFEAAAHNDYLRVIFESGFTGLTLYLFIVFYFLFLSIKKMTEAKEETLINGYKIAFCLIFSLLIMSMADNLARSTVVMFYFYIIVAHLLRPQLQTETV